MKEGNFLKNKYDYMMKKRALGELSNKKYMC